MKTLYIAEKPSLGREIASAIGSFTRDGNSLLLSDGSRVTWVIGHFLSLAEPDHYLSDDVPVSAKTKKKVWRKEDLPIIPQHWHYKLSKKEFAAYLKQIGQWIKEYDVIVHAGDPDREGQAIVDNILDHFKCTKPVKRLWIQDLTDSGKAKALSNIRDNSEYFWLSQSAKARMQADWLVGMNLTRAATLSNSVRQLVSLGRVQTPVLSLIVERDMAIENFISTTHYGVRAIMSADISFKSEWIIPDELKNPEGYLLDHSIAKEVVDDITGKKGLVTSVTKKAGKRSAPLPFSLSELQKYASSKFGMGAQEVLDVAQSLYEKHKATSYPRTDCQYMADEQYHDAKNILSALKKIPSYLDIINNADLSIKSQAFNDKKITAHTAIVPTSQLPRDMTPKEAKIYDIIVKHYVAQFYPDQTFTNTTLELDIEGHKFLSKGKVIKDIGWTVIIGADEDDADSAALPDVSKGEYLPVESVEALEKKTKPPARFNEGSLIGAMTSIAKYVDDPELKKILNETEGLGTEATRANIIETLKKRSFIEVKGKNIISTPAGRQVYAIAPEPMRNPVTTAKWETRLNKIVSKDETFDSFMKDQVDFVTKVVSLLLNSSFKVGTGSTGGNGKGGERKVLGKCPSCGGDITENTKAYGCSNWKEKDCKFVIWKEISQKKITATVVKELLSKNKTAKAISGFKSKAGKDFDAKLKIDENHKVVFDFDK